MTKDRFYTKTKRASQKKYFAVENNINTTASIQLLFENLTCISILLSQSIRKKLIIHYLVYHTVTQYLSPLAIRLQWMVNVASRRMVKCRQQNSACQGVQAPHLVLGEKCALWAFFHYSQIALLFIYLFIYLF